MSLTLVETHVQRRFSCGPLDVRIRADDPTMRARITDVLGLYADGWRGPRGRLDVWVRESVFRRAPVSGSYVSADRMNVDCTVGGLVAVTDSGASGECIFTDTGDYWKLDIPRSAMTPLGLGDLERLLELSLATGWQRRGCVPISGAGVCKNGHCAIITSPPNGGTSTLAAALVRNGWRSLGDRTMLLRHARAGTRLDGLLGAFSLHPEAKAWFPEIGRLDYLPRYPLWTEKRRVLIERVWPGSVIDHAAPTHIVSLIRSACGDGLSMKVLPKSQALALLQASADVPNDQQIAKSLTAVLTGAARVLTPISLEVATGAYADPSCAELFDAFLR